MTKKTFLITTAVVLIAACTPKNSKTPEQWSTQQLASWFEQGDWKHGWKPLPDETVDRKEFAGQYFRNPERWKKAFDFLASNDLKTIEPGRYELEGTDLFENISEYVTKNEDEIQYEAHRQYADIQYVVSGQERIGVAELGSKTVVAPYDSDKDVAFLAADDNDFRRATPENFFIFFPNDAHRPGVEAGGNKSVRKVVVKLRID
jgi:YhcH/YjgK/YiaL family protein